MFSFFGTNFFVNGLCCKSSDEVSGKQSLHFTCCSLLSSRTAYQVLNDLEFYYNSPGSAGNSPLPDNPVLGDCIGIGNGPSNGGTRSSRRSEDGNVYVQCITAVYALARDPSPRVASLGRQVLRIVGVESAQVVVASRVGMNGVVNPQRNASVAALPPTPPMAGVLHRSTSWVASSSGNNMLKELDDRSFGHVF